MAAAGFSLNDAIAAASAYGLYQQATSGAYESAKAAGQMGGMLNGIPQQNVDNIKAGFSATDPATLCGS